MTFIASGFFEYESKKPEDKKPSLFTLNQPHGSNILFPTSVMVVAGTVIA